MAGDIGQDLLCLDQVENEAKIDYFRLSLSSPVFIIFH
jgi:hypothetical protein